jgi:hypothetical protein
MAEQFLDVLRDPGTFYERDEAASSAAVPVLVVVALTAIGGAAGWLSWQATSAMFARMDGAAGVAQAVGAVTVVVSLLGPVLAWVLYAGAFHAMGALLQGEGSFRATFVYAGWGFLPRLLAAVVNLTATWYVLGVVSVPSEVTPASMQAYSSQIQTHPATLAATVVGVAVLLWSAYIWVHAVEAAHDIEREDAAIAVGVPVAIALIIRLSNFVL